jgi:hypothetical protein
MPGIVLALAFAYLYQVAPHGHVDAQHAPSHPAHDAHSDHAHPPAHGPEAGDPSGTAHHHHAVAQHLDFHAVRLCLRAVDRDHGDPAAPAESVDPVRVSMRCGNVPAGPARWAPDDPLLRHAPARAPPA